jgi:hypothetical protein
LFLHCEFTRLDFETVKLSYCDLFGVFGFGILFLAFSCVVVSYGVHNWIL